MDPRYSFKRGYDTDLLILRSLFALDSNTNQPISSFYSPVADGVGGINWLSLDQYFSAGTGVLNFVSSVESFSTVTGLFCNFSTGLYNLLYTGAVSTTTISSQDITVSTLSFLDRTGNSTQTFSLSTGSLYLNGQLFYNPSTVLVPYFEFSLTSTVEGLGTASYISAAQLLSTIDQLGANGLGYVNTPSLVSTVIKLNNNLTSSIAGLPTAKYVTAGNLTSTVGGLGAAGYVSTSFFDYSLTSTIEGLGQAEYISSSQLQSTVIGLGGTGIISTGQLTSTTDGIIENLLPPLLQSSILGAISTSFVSTSQLVSTVEGLGTIGYISTASLVSTVVGLGGTGIVSTGQLTSTTAGLINIMIPPYFASTVAGLGTARYVSTSYVQSTIVSTTAGLLVNVTGPTLANLYSTVGGLGAAGYVSTSGLVSTTIGLQNSFFVVNASQVFIANATKVTISSAGSLIFMSTFYESSITYQGNNGAITASNAAGATAPFYFSSATLNLDRWSTYINSNSVVTLSIYPNIYFANLGLGVNPPLIYMSTFVQGGNNYLSSQMAFSAIYPTTFSNSQSNIYNQPLKMTFPGSAIQGLWPNGTRLAHYMPNALTIGGTNGFANCNMSLYYGSTNSLFLSVQNLPF